MYAFVLWPLDCYGISKSLIRAVYNFLSIGSVCGCGFDQGDNMVLSFIRVCGAVTTPKAYHIMPMMELVMGECIKFY